MKRFELLGTEIDTDGHEWAFIFDSESGETIKSPVYASEAKKKAETVVRVIPRREERVQPVEETVSEEKKSLVPEAFKTKPKNPHAIPNPKYAWQDPDWVSPEEKKERMKHSTVVPPIFGKDITKVFKDPAKNEEKDTYLV